jgi:hypothetical protein
LPVLDTEVLFALNPRDKRQKHALKLLSELREKGVRLHAPDTALMEHQQGRMRERNILSAKKAGNPRAATSIRTASKRLLSRSYVWL